MRISIVGTGYVGLVTGACLAEKGHQVFCVDLDEEKVRRINLGQPTIRETGLEPLLRRHAGKALQATTDLGAAVHGTELTLVAVGTPFDGKTIDLTQVEAAARAIGAALRGKRGWHTVVIKSTVVPGTTEGLVKRVLEESSGKRAGQGFGLGMNPEFLTEGEAVGDFMEPDRLVLGAGDARTLADLEQLYAAFRGVPFIRTNPSTAEMIKYASNTLLATLISWSNEMANLSAALGGIDALEVVEGVRTSRYLTIRPEVRTDAAAAGASGDWTPHGPAGNPGVTAPIAAFLVPGCGFGGSCLPKDTAALAAHGRAAGVPMRILEAVRDVNLGQPGRMVRLVEKRIPDLKGVPVAVLGLAFRPGTGDLRESPAIPIIRDLLDRGALVSAYDPALAEEGASGEAPFGPDVRLCARVEDALADARAAVIVTRWPEFDRLPDILGDRADQPVVVDGRRMLDKNRLALYEGIGL